MAISLATAGTGQSTPVLFGANPVGDALLSTGVLSLVGTNAALVAPLFPVRVAGFDVRETLHRFQAAAQAPSIESGVASVNLTGEALATLTMQWLVAPDAYDANASVTPSRTELDPSRTQRFVMHDAALRFRDRSQSGLKFFGAGRTFPMMAAGEPRLLFAGIAVVVEGLGTMRGLRGSVAIIGEIRSRAIASLVVTGRFDADGPLEAAGSLLPMVHSTGPALDAAVFTLGGVSAGGAGGDEVDEAISALIVENDVAHGTRPRAFVRTGAALGGATGRLPIDASDRRPAVYLSGARRDLTFVDANGRLVGSVASDVLEGTMFPDVHAGADVARVLAYGALAGGTGAFDDAAGVLTLDAAVSRGGATRSVYTLWMIDPLRTFRAVMPAPSRLAEQGEPTMATEFNFVEASAQSMLPADVDVLARVGGALAAGRDLQIWFAKRDRGGDFAERFQPGGAPDSGDERFGFFDVAPVGAFDMPVMGIVHETPFDRLKTAASDASRIQLREFVLGHFLRTCHAPGRDGYRQMYYKLAATGQIGKFAKHERASMVDLRDVGPRYDWITLKTDGLPLNVPFSPLGRHAPSLPVPVEEPGFVVVGPPLVIDTEQPAPGVVAEYGFGYAMVPGPTGPTLFRAGLRLLTFALMEDGEIRSRSVFIASRPETLAPVDVDPLRWSMRFADLATFRMASWLMGPLLAVADRLPLRARNVDPVSAYIRVANTVTGGRAERDFGISREAVEKRMLFEHFIRQQELLLGALQVWRTVPDWTSLANAPSHVDVEKVW